MKSIMNQFWHIIMRVKTKIVEIKIERKRKIQTKYNKIYLPYN